MLSKLLIALALMSVCVALHALGITALLRRSRRMRARATGRFWSTTGTLIRVAAWTVLLHLVEIAVWAAFYTWREGMPDLPSALYFSAVTYTTTGYGDLVLPPEWRLLGAVEALTGILMCGWSTGFFFASVSAMNEAPSRSPAPDAADAPTPTA